MIVILPVEVETELKEAAMTSMGAEVSDLDPVNINNLCNQVLSLSEYRAQHYDDLKSMMNTIAPNLTALVGEVVGARLIVEGGGLLNLAKQPASTVQFLGADSALKTEQATPMCGLINRASLIGQVAPQHKGKIARSLAAKIVLAIRCDAFGHKRDNSMGFANRLKLQRRLRNLECILRNKDRKKGSGVLITPAKIEAEAEKDEEMVPQGEPAVDEKKHSKKNKKEKNDTTADAEDTGGVTEKKKKKHVSEVETGEKKKKKIKHAEPEEERKGKKKNKEKKDTEKKKKKHVFEVEAREEKKKKRKHTEPDAEDEDTGGVTEKQKKKRKHVEPEKRMKEKEKKKKKEKKDNSLVRETLIFN